MKRTAEVSACDGLSVLFAVIPPINRWAIIIRPLGGLQPQIHCKPHTNRDSKNTGTQGTKRFRAQAHRQLKSVLRCAESNVENYSMKTE